MVLYVTLSAASYIMHNQRHNCNLPKDLETPICSYWLMCSKFPTFLNQKAILVCHSFNPSKKIPAKECPLTEEKKSWELLIADAHTRNQVLQEPDTKERRNKNMGQNSICTANWWFTEVHFYGKTWETKHACNPETARYHCLKIWYDADFSQESDFKTVHLWLAVQHPLMQEKNVICKWSIKEFSSQSQETSWRTM